MENLGPTRELIRKLDEGRYIPPGKSQTQDRSAGEIVCPFVTLHDQKKITDGQLAAGLKLSRHHDKAQCRQRVTSSYGERTAASVDNSEDGDEATWTPAEKAYYHGQKKNEAYGAILDDDIWCGLIDLMDGIATIREIGRRSQGFQSDRQAYAAGLTMVRAGLNRLQKFWRLTDQPPMAA